MKVTNSGLIKYLFGDDCKDKVTKEDFARIQTELIDDVLSLGYTCYCPEDEEMSEVDFCRHMLYSSNLSSKKK